MSVIREMPSRLAAEKKQKQADAIQFCQPTLVPKPPNGDGWLHEINHDGYRLAVKRDGAGVRLITRNGHDWSARYPSIASAAYHLKARSFLIDGEVVVTNKHGLPDFNLLRHGPQAKPEAFVYAFDLLELDGKNLRPHPQFGSILCAHPLPFAALPL